MATLFQGRGWTEVDKIDEVDTNCAKSQLERYLDNLLYKIDVLVKVRRIVQKVCNVTLARRT